VVADRSVRHARATVTVDLGAVADNCRVLAAAAAPAELWAVVKADGYGHGAADVGAAALAAGARKLCVATHEEAVALRERLPDAPVLVMGPLVPGEESDVRDLEIAVSSREAYERLREQAAAPLAVHVKVDSGMGRWGMSTADAVGVAAELADGAGPLRLGGLMSHLASAESDDALTARQLERFAEVSAHVPACPRHIGNSAAALSRPDARWDAVRCGIAVYGVSPFGDGPAAHGLRPAMRFESFVAQVKRLEPGDGTGYGHRFTAERPVWIGLVPTGYADGVPRLLSGRMDVLVGGRRRPVVATISMDQLTFLIGADCDVAVGDEVVLLGEQGAESIGPNEWGDRSDTIGYEIVTDIAPRRRRVKHLVVGG
jgi:alanine racemase